jgi:cell division cycle protein 20 (cofactor of APC complex)
LSGEKRNRQNDKRSDETPLQKEFKRRMMSTLCNVPLEKLDEDGEQTGLFSFGERKKQILNENKGVVSKLANPFALDILRTMKVGDSDLATAAHQSAASKVLRKVPSNPTRILDAPDIVDDYYLNLISWSKDNILAVALARSVYLWNASTGDIHHLVTVSGTDYITSVCWSPSPGQTKMIAVGTQYHQVHLFDSESLTKLRTLSGSTGRVASLSWNQHILSAGDRDAVIVNHDIRAESNVTWKYKGHTQEVCGLKWNDDGSCLASGGNENYLCLWDAAMSGRSRFSSSSSSEHAPRLILQQHKAAVKALDWCPFHRGLLASGGGTADRSIKFWNSTSGALLNSIDTGSQVCSIVWSKHQRELCSSHGYSENQLILWKYPSMTKVKELTGHTARVLNMELSPDGSTVVSAGADETLRFWNVFGAPTNRSNADFGQLTTLAGHSIR